MITPEQFSYTAETKLMKIAPSSAIFQAEVLTLSRMAYRVLKEIGGITKTELSKSGKAMVMYSILNDYKKELKFLGKSYDNIDLCIAVIDEFKKHGITLQTLQQEIEKVEDMYLKTKLKDITFVYEKWEKQIAKKYREETDLLTLLADNISKTDLIKNSIIYFDEFAGFTKQEYEVIQQFVKIAKQVNITICVDDLNINTNPDTDIFYSNKMTIAKIWHIANENNFKLEEPVCLKKQYRFQTEELQHLSDNMNKSKPTKYEKDVKNIELFLAKNPYLEIENVAKEIAKLIKNKKLRYQDIAIITKNIQEYAPLVRAIFPSYKIPVFIDEKRDINQNIVIQYILSFLEVLDQNFSSEAIFNYLKLGFSNIEEDEIFALENYCNKWGIKQNKWRQEFIYEAEKKDMKGKVQRFNELRKQIIEPLLQCKERIEEDKTVYNVTKCLYEYIQEQKIEQKIIQKIQELQEKSLLDLANEYIASYKTILDILDEMVLVLGQDKITLEQYSKILKVGLRQSSLGKIPGTQDQVIFGDIDRSRSHKVKVVFMIGLNDGNFPSVKKEEGFLDDKDRERLKEDKIELAKNTLEQLYEDNFNIYKAFTTAENKIYLSYPSSDKEGKPLRPSMLIHKIKRMYPKLLEQSDTMQKDNEVINEEVTYEELLKNIAKTREGQNISDIWYTIYQYYKYKINWQKKLESDLQGLNYTNLPQPIKKENIQKLYGKTLNTSISQLEKYQSCPFSYYLQYGLKLKEKEALKIHTFDTGSFMHETIDKFFEQIRKEKGLKLNELQEEDIYKIVSKIIDQNLQLTKNLIFSATAKYRLLVIRLKRLVSKALKYMIQTLIYSDFSIEGTEIEFGEKGTYDPIILTLDDGKKIEISGKIDRIDTATRRRWKIFKNY